ncbi:hypothetical protein SAMN04487965_3267 [Microbulbifer donghaiensis]|uniref:MetA-pathway of phenol degradation n=1 Tax=Microbulbifer donghaiensis TaxID=494016 RepID=A0A1M5GV67_9GAMM|nr:hypothetical protein [Microbulbifer donghaiensis]SHG07656.1 hypothetical protein SAMN04487965_3267 [Microbulbifer donghaiensis]
MRYHPRTRRFGTLFALLLFTLFASLAQAQAAVDEAEALKKAQDPLADVKALMSDNTISYGTSDDETAYGISLQPVYSIETDRSFNFVLRGVIPYIGAPKGAGLPILGPDPVGGTGRTWGLSDSIVQGFFVPKTDSSIKFGIGPQISLRTRTDSVVGGPGWGGGFAGVVFGSAGNLSYGGILGHHWGQDDFNLTTIRPIIICNTDLFGGSYIGYMNAVTYDWSAPSSSSAWQTPLGLTVGKTFILKSGHMIDFSLGGYKVVDAPKGGADRQLKIGLSFIWP